GAGLGGVEPVLVLDVGDAAAVAPVDQGLPTGGAGGVSGEPVRVALGGLGGHVHAHCLELRRDEGTVFPVVGEGDRVIHREADVLTALFPAVGRGVSGAVATFGVGSGAAAVAGAGRRRVTVLGEDVVDIISGGQFVSLGGRRVRDVPGGREVGGETSVRREVRLLGGEDQPT